MELRLFLLVALASATWPSMSSLNTSSHQLVAVSDKPGSYVGVFRVNLRKEATFSFQLPETVTQALLCIQKANAEVRKILTFSVPFSSYLSFHFLFVLFLIFDFFLPFSSFHFYFFRGTLFLFFFSHIFFFCFQTQNLQRWNMSFSLRSLFVLSSFFLFNRFFFFSFQTQTFTTLEHVFFFGIFQNQKRKTFNYVI